ncbi:MAG: F0F1 ATP synthase subunit gamma [Pseudomonadales bacterium]|nr:F0F1 ATP synthase subunit gamma [Pseudomonadales bacterium]
MSERRNLKVHIGELGEIRDVMDAMKNLALVETRKVTNLLAHRQTLARNLEEVAADFLAYHALNIEPSADAPVCWIVFGSERGFCGDYNEALAEALAGHVNTDQDVVVPVGTRLGGRLEGPQEYITGAEVSEEVPAILAALVAKLGAMQAGTQSLKVHTLHHNPDTRLIEARQLMPPPWDPGKARGGIAPMLNLDAPAFFSELVDRYLFVALQEIAYAALMAENQKRTQHMSGAVRRLDEKMAELTRHYHIERQEEITEEIEVILLTAAEGF